VDIFDGSSGRWSTAALSEGRVTPAATSLPSQGLAIFAGGENAGVRFFVCVVNDVQTVVFVWMTSEAATLCLFVILGWAGCVGREEARFELCHLHAAAC
jgi:hypothetical protein